MPATNPFDQFDATAANPFDQFDTHTQATQQAQQPSPWWEKPQTDYATDIGKSLAAGAGKTMANMGAEVASHPISALADIFARPVIQGATRLGGQAYSELADKTGLPPLSESVAKTLTYPMGGDPDSPEEKLKQALATQVVPAAVQDATGMNMNYQPQTKPGEYAESVGSVLPYAATGLPPASAVGMGIGSQAGKDIASEITDNPKYQEAAGVAGGGLGALASPSLAAKAQDLLKDESSSGTGITGLPKGTLSTNEPVDVSVEQMKGLAQPIYKSLETSGGQMGQQSWDNAVNDAISKGGNQTIKGQPMPGVNYVQEVQDYLDGLKGTPTSLEDLDKVDDFIRDKIGQAFRGGLDKQGASLLEMRDTLRSASKNITAPDIVNPQAFSEWQRADKIWSAYRTAKDIQDGIANAENADVPSTAIKNYFKSFVKNQDNLAPLNDEEIAAAKHAAKYGIITRSLKNIGSRIGAHIAGPIVGGALGSMGGPVGAGIGAVVGDVVAQGAVAPVGAWADARQAARGQNVIDTISQRPEVQEAARAARGLPPVEPPTAPAPLTPTLPGIAAASGREKPATGGIGQQNMQELQKLKTALPPQSNAAPQGNAGDFFAKEAKAESGSNPNATNPNSSASGPFQFTDGTWNQMVKRYGAETGIRVQDKDDPQAQATMAKLYAKDNINRMQPFLQRNPTRGELYAAHVFGADGALRLINATNNNPNQQAIMLFPKSVTSANRSLFFDGAKPRTVMDVYQLLSQKVS